MEHFHSSTDTTGGGALLGRGSPAGAAQLGKAAAWQKEPSAVVLLSLIFPAGLQASQTAPLLGFSGGFYFYFYSAYLSIPQSKGSMHPDYVSFIFYPN